MKPFLSDWDAYINLACILHEFIHREVLEIPSEINGPPKIQAILRSMEVPLQYFINAQFFLFSIVHILTVVYFELTETISLMQTELEKK